MSNVKKNTWNTYHILKDILLPVALSVIGVFAGYWIAISSLERQQRPWIAPDLDENVIISEGNVIARANLTNPGHSPALDAYMQMWINDKEIYPVNIIKSKIAGSDSFRKAIVFPNQKVAEVTSKTNARLLKVDSAKTQLEMAQELLAKGKYYLHTYCAYKSEFGDLYSLKQTFLMKYVKNTDNGIFVDWIYVWASTEPL